MTKTEDDDKVIEVKKSNDKLLIIDCVDKTNHERWSDRPGGKPRNLMNFPFPFRMALIGPPSCSKGNSVKNVIIHAKPEYDRIVVWHVCPEKTQEWDDVLLDKDGKPNGSSEIVSELPELESWEKGKKNLLIVDDIDLSSLSRPDKKRMDRSLGFTSTHCGVSICILVQDLLQIKPNHRRMCNIFVLWRIADLDGLAILARKIGMPRKIFLRIVRENLLEYHDSICFDNTVLSPASVRINFFDKVEISDYS